MRWRRHHGAGVLHGTAGGHGVRGSLDDDHDEDYSSGREVTAAVSGADPRWEAVELYLSMGWKIFPLVPDPDTGRKGPAGTCQQCKTAGPEHDPRECDHLLCHGVYAATDDPHRLAKMCAQVRDGGILAVATGATSGITVIDAESWTKQPHWPTGVEVLDDWERWSGGWSLPPTLRALSQSDGVHFFYRTGADETVRGRNGVLPNIDVKSNGGYVALPPGFKGERRWLGDGLRSWSDIAEPSPELWEWLRTARGSGSGGGSGGEGGHSDGYDYDTFVQSGPPLGYQNEFLNELIFRLVKARETDPGRLMSRVWPMVQTWDQRVGDPWREQDVRGKIDSVVRTVTPNDPLPEWKPPEIRPTIVMPGSNGDESSNVVQVNFRGDSDGPPSGGGGGGEGGGGGPSGPGTGGPAAGDVDPIRLEEATDAGNSNRFARLLGDRIRYVSDLKTWIIWNGVRWERDRKNKIMDMTLHVIDDIRAFAVTQPEEDRNRWVAWAHQSQAGRARREIIAAASSIPQLVLTADELDTNPWTLVVENGIIDLKTGEFAVPRQEDLCTLSAAVSYDPEATCPRWLEHIEFVTQGDKELAAYLRRLAGYTLTGATYEQSFFSLEGTGANGKNVFIEPLMFLMGEYATVASSKLLTQGDKSHAAIMADLVGARMVFVDEIPQGKHVDVERVKSMTGSARMKAQFMKQNWFSFTPQMKLWIAGNEQPRFKDSSDGIWRRMKRILFKGKVAEDRKIADYARLLYEEEGSGILNWCLEGLRDWLALGSLGTPAGVTEAVAELKDDEDHLAAFIEECLEITGGGKESEDFITNAQLWTTYEEWCNVNGVGKGRGDRHTGSTLKRRIKALPGTDEFNDRRAGGGKQQRGIAGARLTQSALSIAGAALL